MKYLIRRILYKLFSRLWLPQISASNEIEIDVVIPIIEKDLMILPLCFEGIKACVKNKIKDIYIVAPQNEAIISFCKLNQVKYVDESTVLGITPKDINLIIESPNGKSINRSGWLFQQLLKLSGAIGTCENFLCIDSDHILVRPHSFIDKKQVPVFYMSAEYHEPYYENIKKISSVKELSYLSYVAHKMIFNKSLLFELHSDIEKNTNKNWIDAIIDSYDCKEGAGFSEFELYGNFVNHKRFRPWNQKALTYKSLDSYPSLRAKYNDKFNSITFSDYDRDK